GDPMTLSNVEHALDIMRSYFVECITRNEWSQDRSEELAQTIAACLRRETEEAQHKARDCAAKLSGDTLRRAIRFVNANLDSKLNWDEIASVVGLDPFTFGRGFKLSTGMTPHQYIIRCRLRRAMKLLANKESTLADIALEVGCSCQSHLTTLFRKHLGTTPGAFRVAARAGQRRSAQIEAAASGNAPNDGALRAHRNHDNRRAGWAFQQAIPP